MTGAAARLAGHDICYWAVVDPGMANIFSNDNTSGPAVVDVIDGQSLESQGCGTWTQAQLKGQFDAVVTANGGFDANPRPAACHCQTMFRNRNDDRTPRYDSSWTPSATSSRSRVG